VSRDRAAFHLERARRLTAALDEIAALESLLPPHNTPTLLVSLRVLRQELELATAALTCKDERLARQIARPSHADSQPRSEADA
jgi:hypothetical protein